MATLFQLPKTAPLFAGESLSGAKLYFFQSGTLTPITTYTTAALSVAHNHPVVADSDGVFAPIFFNEAVNATYRMQLKTSADVLKYDVDSLQTGGFRYDRTAAEIAAGVTPTHYYYEPGDVRRYGAVGDGTTNDSAAIQSAIDVLEAGRGGVVSFPALKFGLGTTGINIAAGEHGIRLVGEASGFTNDEGPASTELSYTGTGTAVSIGGSSSRTDYCGIENICINITGAGSAASCLTTTRTQQFGFVNSQLLTSQSAAAATGQTAWIMDGGADFSAYTSWINSKIRGDFTKGIVTQNGSTNAVSFFGGSILQTCSGTPASTIGLDHAVGDTSFIFGTDFDGWDKAAKFAGDRHTVIARFESGGNTLDVEFVSGSDNNFLVGGIFDPAKVTNSGSNNLVLSTSKFTFTPSGRFGINSTPDYLLDIRDSAQTDAQIKATNANGLARLILANGDRAFDLRCHTDDTFMLRDATADATRIMSDTNGTTVYSLKVDVIATGSLPTGAAVQDGRIVIEDAGAGNRNLILYAGGERFRIDGGAAV